MCLVAVVRLRRKRQLLGVRCWHHSYRRLGVGIRKQAPRPENEKKKQSCAERMHQKLFNRGPGGFDGGGSTNRDKNRSDIQAEHDGFIGRFSIRYEIVTAKHADVITGTISVVVTGIWGAFVYAGGTRL